MGVTIYDIHRCITKNQLYDSYVWSMIFCVFFFRGSQNLVFRLSAFSNLCPKIWFLRFLTVVFFFENLEESLGNRSKLSSKRATKTRRNHSSLFAFSGRSGAQKCFKPRGSAAVGCCIFRTFFRHPCFSWQKEQRIRRLFWKKITCLRCGQW